MSLVQRNIVRVIEEKDLKKKAVAKRAGLTGQALSDIIAGRKVIKADMIPQIAAAMDVPITELFKDNQRGA